MERKLRILYCCFHDTLRSADVPVLTAAGFEVIPMLPSKRICDEFKIDLATYEVDSSWKSNLTLSDEKIKEIRNVDIYRIFNPDGTLFLERHEVGTPCEREMEIVNENIDVIILASFPHALAAVLAWFKGLTCFRLYGHQNPKFRLLDWYFKDFPISKMHNLVDKAEHYFSLPIMHGTLTTEDEMTLGPNATLLSTYVDEKSTFGIKWKKGKSEKTIGTIISYIGVEDTWTQHYQDFKKVFSDFDYVVLGKNDKNRVNDPKVISYNTSREQFLEEMSRLRIFINIGQTKQHSQYSPFESILMGIPTLFLSSSGFANDIIERSGISMSDLRSLGMCDSWDEIVSKVKELKDDFGKLIDLSQRQKTLLDKTFSFDISVAQAKLLYGKMQSQLDYLKAGLKPKKVRKKTIFYAFIHKVQLQEEARLFVKAGMDLVPMAAPGAMLQYHGLDYNDLTTPTNQIWLKNNELPDWVVRKAREINLLGHERYDQMGYLDLRYIEFLNVWFDAVYVPALVPMALHLLYRGYTGVILLRYFGHYNDGWSRTKESDLYKIRYTDLSQFPNYYWLPSMPALSKYEAPEIAPADKTILLQCLRNTENIKQRWVGKSSIPKVVTTISLAERELKHYYDRFVRALGHLPYSIFGKNKKGANGDANVVGQTASEDELFSELVKYRVYVDVGEVDHHMHYTPLEAMVMGIPTLFLDRGGVGSEVQRMVNKPDLPSYGLCTSFEDMAQKAKKCLDDADYAYGLALKQREVITALFDESVVVAQIKNLQKTIDENNKVKPAKTSPDHRHYKIYDSGKFIDEPMYLEFRDFLKKNIRRLKTVPLLGWALVAIYKTLLQLKRSL